MRFQNKTYEMEVSTMNMYKKINFLLLLCLLAALTTSCGLFKSPENEVKNEYSQFIKHISDKEYEEVWNTLSYETQTQYTDGVYKPAINQLKFISPENKKQNFPNTNIPIENIEKMQPKEYFIFQMEQTELRADMLRCFAPERSIEKIEINNDTATLTMSKTNDKTISDKIPMKMEDGKWRVILFPPGEIKI